MKNKVKSYMTIFIMAVLCSSSSQLFAQGSWTAPVASGGVEGIHMGMLHTDRVFVYGWREGGPHVYRIFNPANPTQGTSGSTSGDHFCAGHSVLEDGSFLIVDGTAGGAIARFNPITETFPVVGNTITNDERWYPSTMILGNGLVVTFGGVPSGGTATSDPANLLSAEIYNPTSHSINYLNGGGAVLGYQQGGTAYSRVFMVPTNNPNPNIFKIFNPGPSAQSYFYEINTNTLTSTMTLGPVDPFTPPASGGEPAGRLEAIYVRLHDGRVLAAGGFSLDESTAPVNTAAIVDPEAASPSWSAVASMNVSRHYFLASMLADGRVLVYGSGTSAEIYNPATNTWTNVPNMSLPRGYHATGVLMPDGKVIVSGGQGNGGLGGYGETDQIQIYSPDYLTAGARPTITSSPTQAGYGQNINVGYTSSSPITDVVLRRPGTSTHSFTYNMIGVSQLSGDIAVTDNGSSLTVTVPSNPTLLPPGYYMMYIFRSNSGTQIPSVAAWVQIGDFAPAETDPPTPNPATFASAPTVNGSQIDMTATAGSDATLPIDYFFDETSGNFGGDDSGWQNSTSYSDTSLIGNTQYCYTVQMRDGAGNAGTASSPSCATTGNIDSSAPTPIGFAVAPSAVGDTMITMTALTASDDTPPISYQFQETSGNSGATSSGWQSSTTHLDYGLTPNTQYCYQVRARDAVGIPNVSAYSANTCATTNVEDGYVEIQVGPGNVFTPSDVTINVGDTVEWNFVEGGHNVWAGLTGAHNFFDNNPSQIIFSSSATPQTTNPAGVLYAMTFDQTFLCGTTGDGGSSNVYNYHCHIHGSGIPNFMAGQITINGGMDADLNNDNIVNVLDLNLFASGWLMPNCNQSNNYCNETNLSCDGLTSLNDFALLHGFWLNILDNTAPTPNPATFASPPAADSDSAISMIATTGSDVASPVEYFFDEISGNSGGSDSAWQTSTSYTDSGLAESTQYQYTVQMRDAFGNVGTASAVSSATTDSSCGSGQPFSDYLGAGHTTGITVTQSSSDGTSTGLKTIDGSGLTGNAHDTSEFSAWQSPDTAANPNPARGTGHWIQYDFGQLYTLGMLHVWNHNETCCTTRGMQSVKIDYSQDGSTWIELTGVPNFPQAPGNNSYTGFDAVDFGGICARYVIITSISNYGDGFSHSLGEVKFNLNP